MTNNQTAFTIKCDLCGDMIEESEIAAVDDRNCCRPCSVSTRSDLSLVDAFVEWHRQFVDSVLHFTRIPEMTEFRPGLFGAVSEFELPDVIGSISMRADGQCDTDVLKISTGHTLFTYAILITPAEVRNHVSTTYETIKRENNKGCCEVAAIAETSSAPFS
jgi:hypothetical protein